MQQAWFDVWSEVNRQVFVRQAIQHVERQEFIADQVQVTPTVDNHIVQDDQSPDVARSDQREKPSAGLGESDSNHRGARLIPVQRHRPCLATLALPPTEQANLADDLESRRAHRKSVKRHPGNLQPRRVYHWNSKPLPPTPTKLSVCHSTKRGRGYLSTHLVHTPNSPTLLQQSVTMGENPLIDVMKASYDYEATAEDEMTIKEDQLLYLVNHVDDE